MTTPTWTPVMRSEVVLNLRNLRSVVDDRLKELDESNREAAERAGRSAAQWSRILSGASISEEQFVLVANGLDLSVTELAERCR